MRINVLQPNRISSQARGFIAMAQISSRPQRVTLNMQTAALVRAAKAW
jgi:hypothetical protein